MKTRGKAIQQTLPNFGPKRLLGWDVDVSPSLLGSLLQKAVRRNQVELAVRAAASLWASGDDGRIRLVRRLPIIVVEDAVLGPWYDELVGVMIAAGRKRYTEEEVDLQFLLDVVAAIAATPYHDGPWPHVFPGVTDEAQSAIGRVEGREKDLVVALLRRATYGGTEGDVRLLRGMATVWAKRFAEGDAWGLMTRAYEQLAVAPPYEDLQPIRSGDFEGLPTAVDYHVTPVVQILMKKEKIAPVVGGDPEVLRKLMWFFDVGVTGKVNLLTGVHFDWSTASDFPPGAPGEWEARWREVIEPELRSLQRWWVAKRLGGKDEAAS